MTQEVSSLSVFSQVVDPRRSAQKSPEKTETEQQVDSIAQKNLTDSTEKLTQDLAKAPMKATTKEIGKKAGSFIDELAKPKEQQSSEAPKEQEKPQASRELISKGGTFRRVIDSGITNTKKVADGTKKESRNIIRDYALGEAFKNAGIKDPDLLVNALTTLYSEVSERHKNKMDSTRKDLMQASSKLIVHNNCTPLYAFYEEPKKFTDKEVRHAILQNGGPKDLAYGAGLATVVGVLNTVLGSEFTKMAKQAEGYEDLSPSEQTGADLLNKTTTNVVGKTLTDGAEKLTQFKHLQESMYGHPLTNVEASIDLARLKKYEYSHRNWRNNPEVAVQSLKNGFRQGAKSVGKSGAGAALTILADKASKTETGRNILSTTSNFIGGAFNYVGSTLSSLKNGFAGGSNRHVSDSYNDTNQTVTDDVDKRGQGRPIVVSTPSAPKPVSTPVPTPAAIRNFNTTIYDTNGTATEDMDRIWKEREERDERSTNESTPDSTVAPKTTTSTSSTTPDSPPSPTPSTPSTTPDSPPSPTPSTPSTTTTTTSTSSTPDVRDECDANKRFM